MCAGGMESAQDYCIVFVTIDSYEHARQIGRTLVSEQLIACCNIIPGLTSLFGWQGTVTEAQEYLMMLKTAHRLLPEVEKRVSELHPYDVPEIISVGMQESSLPYLRWMQQTMQ